MSRLKVVISSRSTTDRRADSGRLILNLVSQRFTMRFTIIVKMLLFINKFGFLSAYSFTQDLKLRSEVVNASYKTYYVTRHFTCCTARDTNTCYDMYWQVGINRQKFVNQIQHIITFTYLHIIYILLSYLEEFKGVNQWNTS